LNFFFDFRSPYFLLEIGFYTSRPLQMSFRQGTSITKEEMITHQAFAFSLR